jgi:hypothetical protein
MRHALLVGEKTVNNHGKRPHDTIGAIIEIDRNILTPHIDAVRFFADVRRKVWLADTAGCEQDNDD